jgi:hypothetical protein
MIKRNQWAFLIATMLMLASCAPVYLPNTRNAPLFRGAGEFQGSVHVTRGFDAQAAVSVTNHFGVSGSWNYVSNTDTKDQDNYLKHSLWDAAIGYYENTDKVAFEVFGGYGKGDGTSYGKYYFFDDTDVRVNGTYQRFFIQPSIGSNNRIFNWIATVRVSVVDFDKITNLDTAPGSIPETNNPDPVVFMEPSFTGRIFFGKTSPIYTQLQVGVSFSPQRDPVFDFQPFLASFGLGFRIGGIKKVVSAE